MREGDYAADLPDIGGMEGVLSQTAMEPIRAGSALTPSSGSTALYTWIKVAVIAIGFAWLFRNNLIRLWDKTNFISGDRNWYHSMTIPLVGLYYLFLHRDELASVRVSPLLGDRFTKVRFLSGLITASFGAILYFGLSRIVPSIDSTISISGLVQNVGLGILILSAFVLLLDWGLGTLLAGLALSAYGVYPGQNDFLWDMGMVLTLFGVVLTLCGWDVMRIAWFPIVFLVCAIPWPPLVYSQLALPLQKLAAISSVAVLNVLGVDASHGGSKIFMPQYGPGGIRIADRALNVAEACAGLIALMTFISIATTVAFLSSRALWQKLLICASAIPIAILCNVMRVTGVGLLDLYLGQEWSEGFAHQFAGMILYLPAFLMIMLVCWVVDQLVIDESDQPLATTPTPAGGAA